jgi:hypothetical protein
MAADPQQSAGAARTAAMQEEMQAELQVLARKLLDLWQDHISALAQDPTLMAQALKLMSAYAPFPWLQPGAAPTGGTGFAPFPNQFQGGPFPGFPFGAPAGPAFGAATAAAAPDAGDGAVGELRRRVAELEGRLAELERGGKPKPARKRAAKPRAGTPKGG